MQYFLVLCIEFQTSYRPGRNDEYEGKNTVNNGAGHLRIEKERNLGSNQRERNTDLSSSGGDLAGGITERCSVGDGTVDCNELRCVNGLFDSHLIDSGVQNASNYLHECSRSILIDILQTEMLKRIELRI